MEILLAMEFLIKIPQKNSGYVFQLAAMRLLVCVTHAGGIKTMQVYGTRPYRVGPKSSQL